MVIRCIPGSRLMTAGTAAPVSLNGTVWCLTESQSPLIELLFFVQTLLCSFIYYLEECKSQGILATMKANQVLSQVTCSFMSAWFHDRIGFSLWITSKQIWTKVLSPLQKHRLTICRISVCFECGFRVLHHLPVDLASAASLACSQDPTSLEHSGRRIALIKKEHVRRTRWLWAKPMLTSRTPPLK